MELDEKSFAGCVARIAARGSIGNQEATAILEMISERADAQKPKAPHTTRTLMQLGSFRRSSASTPKADAVRNAKNRIDIIEDATKGGTITKHGTRCARPCFG
jgi:hypothetical protein